MEAVMVQMKKKVIPKLRFKEFNVEWEIKPLIELTVNGFSNGAFNDPKKVGQGYRIINVKDMYIDGTININSLTRVAIDEKEFNKNRVEYGDIFFTRSSLVKEGIAYSNVNLNIADDLTFDGHLIRMRPNKDVHAPVFLYYNFSTATARKQFIKRGKTATMTTIGQEDIAKVEIIFPTLPEQQKIASFLSAIDEKIQQLTRKKDLLEKYKKGVMQLLFSGKLRFKDENRKAYPKWDDKRLGEVCIRIGDGIHTTPKYDDDGSYYFVNGNNLSNGKITLNDTTKKVSESEYLKHSRDLGKNTILLSINGTIGNISFCDNEKIVLGKSACYINVINDINLKYIYLILQSSSIINYFNSELTGSTIKNLSLKTIRETPINLPCIGEQQKIADYLSSIDTKIESVANQITQTQTFKKGLLQQMFV